MKKVCTGCGLNKQVEEFSKDKSKKDGFCTRCKLCVKEYKLKNKDKIAEYQRNYSKKYREDNKELLANNTRIYREKNKERISEQKKIYTETHKEEKHLYDKEYREKNKKHITDRQREYVLNNKERISKYKKEYYIRNKDIISKKTKEYRKLNSDKLKYGDLLYRKANANYKTFSDRLTIDELPLLASDGISLEVKCKYCGKYFIPTNKMVADRVYALNNYTYDNFLYCSDGCKDACPIYNQNKYPKGFKKATSREVQAELRQLVLERDNWACRKCGKAVGDVELHCHHILPLNGSPIESADVGNCITLCKECHKQVHRLPDCNYYELRCKD